MPGIVLGAVAYAEKVVAIWDGFQKYFRSRGLDFDYVLYSNYESQVEAHVLGRIDVAWNSPLAWVQSARVASRLGRRAEAICMRDTDRDLTSVVLVQAASELRHLDDLKGKKVAVGARDSPQATLIPLGFLADHGLHRDRDINVVAFDKLVGKHGDHIGGERDAVRALLAGEVAAACIVDKNYLGFGRDGSLPLGSVRILATTPPFDHCNFTIFDNTSAEAVARFRELLMAMSYADPGIRPLLDLEGLKSWMPGRAEGYAQLSAAVDRQGTIAGFVDSLVARAGSTRGDGRQVLK